MPKKWYFVLPLIVFAVSIGDLCVTIHADREYDEFVEANPIAAHIWDTHGDTGLIVFKLSITLVSCTCMAWAIKRRGGRWTTFVSVFGLSVCAFLVGWWIFWFFN